jgi:hypothetical protein
VKNLLSVERFFKKPYYSAMMPGLFMLYPCTMSATAPEGYPRGGSVIKSKNTSLPQRGPDAGVIHIQCPFLAVERIDSCLFPLSQIVFFFLMRNP